MNRVVITGDTHGVLDIKKLIKYQSDNNKKLSYDDYLIICGDTGIVWNKDSIKEVVDVYENLGTNILFVDGNHENYDLLNEYRVESWNGGKVHKISPHIIHLMRGYVFNVYGYKVFAIGGAESHDKENRIEHFSWWKDEEITYADYMVAYENLKTHNFNVDYVISHTLPNSAIKSITKQLTYCGESIPNFLYPKLKYSQTSEILEELKQKMEFKTWFSGHLHIDDIIDNHFILYEDIIEI